jgi:septal ring factor EnvC (AmiA/AmiB activator)
VKVKDACIQLEHAYGKELLHPHGKCFLAWDTIADELMLAQQLRKRVEALEETVRHYQIEKASLEADLDSAKQQIYDLEEELWNGD